MVGGIVYSRAACIRDTHSLQLLFRVTPLRLVSIKGVSALAMYGHIVVQHIYSVTRRIKVLVFDSRNSIRPGMQKAPVTDISSA